jgi:hypothetical protein
VRTLQFDPRLVFLVDRDDLDRRCARQKRAHDYAGAVTQGMHAEQRMGGPMLQIDKTLQLFRGQDHRPVILSFPRRE